jgi:DNA helicase INO80
LGVTLTAANNVIFYDNDWNPTMDAQATDRAHRIGQTLDVFVYQLVTKNTIEDRIVKRAEQKKTVQSTVYEGGSLNIFKKEIIDLMADEMGMESAEDQKKDEQNTMGKKRGPRTIKPTIGKTKEKEKEKMF